MGGMLGRSFTPKYGVNVTATTHDVRRAIQTTQKRFLQYSPAPDCAKPTGIRPIIVTSVPASIGAAVWLQQREGYRRGRAGLDGAGGTGDGGRCLPLLRGLAQRSFLLRQAGRLEQPAVHRRRLLRRPRRVQHRSGGAQLCFGVQRGWSVASHAGSGARRGQGLDNGGARCAAPATLPRPRSYQRGERCLSRRGAGGRCPFRYRLRARVGAHWWVSDGGSTAGGRDNAAGDPAL